MEHLASIIEALEAKYDVPDDPRNTRAAPDIPKDLVTAAFCRNKGDDYHKQKLYMDALIAYNRSICHTTTGSPELGLLYAKRSAVYFDGKVYSKCLENIQLAREHGFPAKRISELDEREKACLNKADGIFDPWSFFKLSHPPNAKIPFIVNCLELREDKKFGRHIVTTRDLKVGDFIAIEEPYFTFWHDSCDVYRCSICLKSNHVSLIPCEKCARVMYCSQKCQLEDTVHTLKHDEHNPKNFDRRPESFRLAFMMQVKAFKISGELQETLSFLKNAGSKTVFDFDWSDPNDPSYNKNRLACVQSLSKICIDLVPLDPDATKTENQMMRFTHDQLRLHQTNSYSMYETRRDVLEPKKDPYHNNLIGTGIFPFAALLNNSCYPNVKQITVDNKIVLVVVRPIAAQEQIFISYGYCFFRMPLKARQAKLLEFYKFKCTCVACEKDYPLLPFLLKADKKFYEPQFTVMPSVKETLALFKKNCTYINKKIRIGPTYEVVKLMQDIDNHLHSLAKIDFT